MRNAVLLSMVWLLTLAATLQAQPVADEAAVGERDAHAVLNDWIVASRERGAFEAEVKCWDYDETFSTIRMSHHKVRARSPQQWRLEITNDSDDAKLKTQLVRGRTYTIESRSPETWNRFDDQFCFIDITQRQFDIIQFTPLSPEDSLAKPEPAGAIGWLWQNFQPPSFLLKNEQLLAFPHLSDAIFVRSSVSFGEGSTDAFHHLLLVVKDGMNGRIELQIDKNTSLLHASRISHQSQSRVYRVLDQRPLSAQAAATIQPVNIDALEFEGYWDLRRPLKSLHPGLRHLAQ